MKCLNDGVSLREILATGSFFLPTERDRIEAEDFNYARGQTLSDAQILGMNWLALKTSGLR